MELNQISQLMALMEKHQIDTLELGDLKLTRTNKVNVSTIPTPTTIEMKAKSNLPEWAIGKEHLINAPPFGEPFTRKE